MNLLIVCAEEATSLEAAALLPQRWLPAGLRVQAVLPCHMLVREVVRLAPDAVVLMAPLDDALCAALALLADTAARPLLALSDQPPPTDAAQLQPLLAAHLMAWLPAAAEPPAVAAALALAQARFAREQQLRSELAEVRARLDERKWVDRAKGVLMHHQHLAEDDAFALLRSASMQANLRVGEVARNVIEAAQAAEAVNRAGKLRMLSQRYVKALALRAHGGARPRVDDPLAETAQRLQGNLELLAGQRLPESSAALLAEVGAAWSALQQAAAAGAPAAAALPEADRLAEDLLVRADALTAALERGSGRPSVRLVNLCGRQRMLSQRLAKQALLAGLLAGEAADAQAGAVAETVQAFEATMKLLEQAPLTNEAIRSALAQARGQWQRLLDGLRRASGSDAAAARAVLARESEALLASFESLTTLYEHSMQVLLG